jgi:hypothetical protein
LTLTPNLVRFVYAERRADRLVLVLPLDHEDALRALTGADGIYRGSQALRLASDLRKCRRFPRPQARRRRVKRIRRPSVVRRERERQRQVETFRLRADGWSTPRRRRPSIPSHGR